MWLIDWLVARWQSVTNWFSDNYWIVRNMLDSLPQTIQSIYDRILNYYNIAKDYVNSYIHTFYKNYIEPNITDVRDYILSVIEWLNDRYTLLQTSFDNLPNTISDIITNFIGDIYNGYNYLKDEVLGYINDIRTFDLPLINVSIADIQNEQLGLRDLVLGQLAPDIQELRNLYNTTKDKLVAFLDNPAGFILDLLWGVILSYLCYLLGYGLGSTKYELPPKPNWNKKG